MRFRSKRKVKPDVSHPAIRKFSFFIDRCVTPGIYSLHLEGRSPVLAVPGAANDAGERRNSQSRDYDQALIFAIIEDQLDFARNATKIQGGKRGCPEFLALRVHDLRCPMAGMRLCSRNFHEPFDSTRGFSHIHTQAQSFQGEARLPGGSLVREMDSLKRSSRI